jgi:hypothetical protein
MIGGRDRWRPALKATSAERGAGLVEDGVVRRIRAEADPGVPAAKVSSRFSAKAAGRSSLLVPSFRAHESS